MDSWHHLTEDHFSNLEKRFARKPLAKERGEWIAGPPAGQDVVRIFFSQARLGRIATGYFLAKMGLAGNATGYFIRFRCSGLGL